MARETRRELPRVRFTKAIFYSRYPNAEEYRCFFPFVNHVEECPRCIQGINGRQALCRIGFHLGKKVLVHIYEERGEIYSTYDRDVNNQIVRLELCNSIINVRRVAQILDVKFVYNVPHNPSRSRQDQSIERLPSLY